MNNLVSESPNPSQNIPKDNVNFVDEKDTIKVKQLTPIPIPFEPCQTSNKQQPIEETILNLPRRSKSKFSNPEEQRAIRYHFCQSPNAYSISRSSIEEHSTLVKHDELSVSYTSESSLLPTHLRTKRPDPLLRKSTKSGFIDLDSDIFSFPNATENRERERVTSPSRRESASSDTYCSSSVRFDSSKQTDALRWANRSSSLYNDIQISSDSKLFYIPNNLDDVVNIDMDLDDDMLFTPSIPHVVVPNKSANLTSNTTRKSKAKEGINIVQLPIPEKTSNPDISLVNSRVNKKNMTPDDNPLPFEYQHQYDYPKAMQLPGSKPIEIQNFSKEIPLKKTINHSFINMESPVSKTIQSPACVFNTASFYGHTSAPSLSFSSISNLNLPTVSFLVYIITNYSTMIYLSEAANQFEKLDKDRGQGGMSWGTLENVFMKNHPIPEWLNFKVLKTSFQVTSKLLFVNNQEFQGIKLAFTLFLIPKDQGFLSNDKNSGSVENSLKEIDPESRFLTNSSLDFFENYSDPSNHQPSHTVQFSFPRSNIKNIQIGYTDTSGPPRIFLRLHYDYTLPISTSLAFHLSVEKRDGFMLQLLVQNGSKEDSLKNLIQFETWLKERGFSVEIVPFSVLDSCMQIPVWNDLRISPYRRSGRVTKPISYTSFSGTESERFTNDDEIMYLGNDSRYSADTLSIKDYRERFYYTGQTNIYMHENQMKQENPSTTTSDLIEQKIGQETGNDISLGCRNGILIREEEWLRTDNGQYLNDILIDFYLMYLQNNMANISKRVSDLSDELSHTPNLLQWHAFTSYFYKVLSVTNEKLISSSKHQSNDVSVEKLIWSLSSDDENVEATVFSPNGKRVNENEELALTVRLDNDSSVRPANSSLPISSDAQHQEEQPSHPGLNDLPTSILSFRSTYERVKKWSRHLDIFTKDLIFIPIHESLHWYLVVIVNPGQLLEDPLPPEKLPSLDRESSTLPCSILVFDSLSTRPRPALFRRIRHYLLWEAYDKKHLLLSTERIASILGTCVKVPFQSNATDCGVYLLHYVEKIISHPNPAELIFNFVSKKDYRTWFDSAEILEKRKFLRNLIENLTLQQNQKQRQHHHEPNKK